MTKESSSKKVFRGKKRKSDTDATNTPESESSKNSLNGMKMSSPTASPAKKKNKLSLKGKDSILSKSVVNSPKDKNNGSHAAEHREETATPKKVHKPPCVAALYNLGNTCFLNSVLQVLRYTPGFVSKIDEFAAEVAVCRKEKAFEEQPQDGKDDLTWNIVTNLQQTFKKMVRREKDFRAERTPYTGVRPYDLLDTIENLNPMFSGGEQHDAHELLGCLMAYLQDAATEINKHRKLNQDKLDGKVPMVTKTKKEEEHVEEEDSKVTHLGEEPVSNNVAHRKVQDSDCNGNASDGGHADKGGHVFTTAVIESPSKICADLGLDEQIDGTTDAKSLQENRPVRKSTRQQKIKQTNIANDENAIKGDLNKVPREDAEAFNNASKVKTSEGHKSSAPVVKKSAGEGQSTILSMFGTTQKRYGTSRVVKAHGEQTNTSGGARSAFKPPSPSCKSDTNIAASRLHVASSVYRIENSHCCIVHDMNGHGDSAESLSNGNKMEDDNSSNSKLVAVLENLDDVLSKGDSVDDSSYRHRNEVASVKDAKLNNGDSQQQKHVIDQAEELTSPELKAEALCRGKSANVKLKKLKMTNFFSKVKKVQESKPDLKVDLVNDYIAEMCHGTMALRTQCLVCERSTERKETFQDISVPVRKQKYQTSESDDEEDDEDKENVSPCQWLLDALAETERLAEDNKYFCDYCYHLVEAQRSLNYVKMPPILTLHLKRFAALSGFYGTFAKINDHVPIPQHLPCFRDECKKKRCHEPEHGYELYALITHTGVSLSSGHYVAYVRAPIGARPHLPTAPAQAHAARVLTFDDDEPNKMAQSPLNSSVTSPKKIVPMMESSSASCNKKSPLGEQMQSPSHDHHMGVLCPSHIVCTEDEPLWYECDDEFVTVMSQADMDRMLLPNGISPYLLFYKQCA